LIVEPRTPRPTLSQEEKEKGREGKKERGRGSREGHSSDAGLGVNAKEMGTRADSILPTLSAQR
jgi:hypothetical protein